MLGESDINFVFHKESISFLQQHVNFPDAVLQLAEEAGELAAAAAKFTRGMYGSNPTPKSNVQLLDATIEEMQDVINCLAVMGLRIGGNNAKLKRWCERIRESESKNQLKNDGQASDPKPVDLGKMEIRGGALNEID